MGRGSKKKRRGGGGGGGGRKGRASLKDNQPVADDASSLIAEEIVALAAIFEDDFRLVSESPHPQFTIGLRPYSNVAGDDGSVVSAQLFVRCVEGYPYKCPKLRIIPQEGLSEDDSGHLLSLLLDQANANAREGRVMIFNLVEVAQEYLSEVTPVLASRCGVPSLGVDKSDQRSEKDMVWPYDGERIRNGHSVYGLIDLFSDLDIGADATNENLGKMPHDNTSMERIHGGYLTISSEDGDAGFYKSGNMKGETSKDKKVVRSTSIVKLDTLLEELENSTQSSSSTASDQLSEELSLEETSTLEDKDDLDIAFVKEMEKTMEDDQSEPWVLSSLMSELQNQSSQIIEKDLLVIHLLRLVCSLGGPLAGDLHKIVSELFQLGIVSEHAKGLALESSSSFPKVFQRVFREQMASSSVANFWKANVDCPVDGTSSLPSSRYLNDFEELSSLGRGGFGFVVLCRNKIDERRYAVKKIRLKDKSLLENVKILREVATLSRLQHQHIVRYYQAWFETEVGGSHGHALLNSRTEWSSMCSYSEANSDNSFSSENKSESSYLYIQMEYCPRTLRQVFDSSTNTGQVEEGKGLGPDTDLIQWRQTFEVSSGQIDKEYPWHLFRQIAEGLAHIHAQKIIHRDLTPNNIFFDAQGDIKIGDFGLAKFLKAEQVDHDSVYTSETAGSVDGTGRVGTYFYTAPEIEQGWPHIDEKVDMYSLGVVLFELWHPFSTAMERHVVLSELKHKRFPPAWIAKFPQQENLVRRLMSENPSDRPTAEVVIEHLLPPRMEDKWLKDILRMIQTAEKSYVYDRVMSTLFDEDKLIKKYYSRHSEKGKTPGDCPSAQFADLDAELRDHVMEVAKEICRLHGARRLEVAPLQVLDGNQELNEKAVKLLTRSGNMVELCHDLRLPFVDWIVKSQRVSFKRYEVSSVFRRGVGHSPPNRYLQGDFDIVGGAAAVTEAEAIKVAVDIATRVFHPSMWDIRLNHDRVLDSVWSWIGIDDEMRQSVAKVLSSMFSLRPQSSARKSKWVFIRRQLIMNLHLKEDVVDRIQTANIRFCGSPDVTLARLRGVLPFDKASREALDELSTLVSYLRIWQIEDCLTIDVLMPPAEHFYRKLFFQIYKANAAGSAYEGQLLAIGGRYDYLVQKLWQRESKSSPPGAVGVSLALEKFLLPDYSAAEIKHLRHEQNTSVLVCAKAGGGLLVERMELVAELWQANIKAEFVPIPDPSLTDQYEYASEHEIKCLVIITESGLSQTGSVKVRSLELKKEKEVNREDLIKFLVDAISTQFRNLSIWI